MDDYTQNSYSPLPNSQGGSTPPSQQTPMPIPPLQPLSLPTVPSKPSHSPGNIILQWLTYALWGWTILATSVLIVTVLESFLNDANPGDFTAYAVAAVLVLLPISVVCDVFYTKQEPTHKTGGASIVMVIHAVLFALFAVGALITAVFSVVNLMTSSSESVTAQISLYSSLLIAVLYISVLVRTILPKRLLWARRAFVMEMVIVVGIVALLGIVGPAAKARATRTDRLIDSNIADLQYTVESYVSKNSALPQDLHALTLNGDTKKLVEENLVTYKANTKPPTGGSANSYSASKTSSDSNNVKTFYYQLCADYKKESKSKYNYSNYDQADANGYVTYITTDSHSAGEVCYKLRTPGY